MYRVSAEKTRNAQSRFDGETIGVYTEDQEKIRMKRILGNIVTTLLFAILGVSISCPSCVPVTEAATPIRMPAHETCEHAVHTEHAQDTEQEFQGTRVPATQNTTPCTFSDHAPGTETEGNFVKTPTLIPITIIPKTDETIAPVQETLRYSHYSGDSPPEIAKLVGIVLKKE